MAKKVLDDWELTNSRVFYRSVEFKKNISRNLELSKPSQSKKKKKKKEGVVTGLSQFVTTKMSAYRQIYPELNDREIAMKLAGKWERLSDKKKVSQVQSKSSLVPLSTAWPTSYSLGEFGVNKYEKLALKKMPSEEVD